MEKQFYYKYESEAGKYDDSDAPFEVEFSAEFFENDAKLDEDYYSQIAELDAAIEKTQRKVERLDERIDRFEVHADLVDYHVAGGCGLLTGLIDALLIGSMDNAQQLSSGTVDSLVMKIAKKKTGYSGNSIAGAINSLEDDFKVPADNIWKGKNERITGESHHLDDLAHHPTPVGLFFSILTQFTYKGYFQNKEGKWLVFDVVDDKLIGLNFKSKLSAGVVNWFFHLVSDLAGSSGTRYKGEMGMGIPGPIISFAKEVACLKPFNKTKLVHQLKVAFQNYHCDLRCELTQSLPVILNEVLVRTFFMIRRLVIEIKKIKNGGDISIKNLMNIIPFHNHTIARMMTVATGAFTGIDVIIAAAKCSAKVPFAAHINVVGVGRFVMAVGTDLRMGLKKNRLIKNRLIIYNEMLLFSEARLYYKTANMLKGVEQAERDVAEVVEFTEATILMCNRMLQEDMNSLMVIQDCLPGAIELNPEIKDMIDDIFK